MYSIDEQYFLEKRKEIYKIVIHCKNNCPYYRKNWRFQIPSYEDFNYKFFVSEIPILQKKEVLLNSREFLMDGISENELFKESTSGSEGMPLICYKSYNEKLRFTRDLWMTRRKIVKDLSPNDRMVHFFVSRRHMDIDEKERFLYEDNILHLSLFDLSEHQLIIFWKEIIRFRPRWMHGFPSSVYALAKVIKKYRLPEYHFELIEMTGEFLKKEVEQYIRDIFKCKITNEYGTREFWLLAYGCANGNLHINDKNVYIESKHKGNEMIVTGLQNYAWPLIRYQLGDKGEICYNKCGCGIRNKYVLELQWGRKADMCVLGENILSKVFFAYLMKAISEQKYNIIRQYQIVKTGENSLEINIVGELRNKEEISLELVKTIKQRIPEIDVDIKFVDYVKPDPYTGKVYDFVDESKKSREIILCTLAPITHRTAEENLGIGYLASYLRKNGYIVKIIDTWLEEISEEEFLNILSYNSKPLLIGFSCYQTNIEKTIRMAHMLRSKLGVPILCGGFGPTFNPDYFLKKEIDFVIRGEGEEAILELCDYLSGKGIELSEIKNLSYRNENYIYHNKMRPLFKNLDDLPFPDRDTMPYCIKRKSTVHLMTSRGCMGGCVFCSVISFFRQSQGAFWRSRSLESIMAEIENLYKAGVRHIKIIDDSFIEKERDGVWCKKFADMIEERNIKMTFRASIRADRVEEEILRELKRAGFFSFSCGIENAAKTALKRMNKGAKLEENINALNLFKKYGYYVQAGFILFDPYTTLTELKENCDFFMDYDWIITKGIFSEMYAAEGTNFTTQLRRNDIIQEEKLSEGNNQYCLLDKRAQMVYQGLKEWHRSHMRIYDMTIDPLSSPKGIEIEAMNEFYYYMMKLKKKDIIFLKNLIYFVENNDIYEKGADMYTREVIKAYEEFYKEVYMAVSELYRKYNLKYDAEDNPFV